MEKLVFPKNEEKAKQMEDYMRNQFLFAGVPKPERANLQKKLSLDSKCLSVSEIIALADYYYGQIEREYQYLAIDLVQRNVQRFTFDELRALIMLVERKEWWDSIDLWRKVYSTWCLHHLEQLESVFVVFAQQDDFWLRRIAITLQLGFKEKTETQLLAKAIEADRMTNEFFIQKAIGWALRDYSKTDADWVREQLAKDLSPLATREASIYKKERRQKMKRKLFAFDIDGTLLDTNKQALDSTREALDKLRKAGHLVTIATGRSRFHAQEVIRDLDFTNYILCNGAAGFLDHEQVYKNLLDREQLDRFVEEAHSENIDTAFVSLDNIKRSSSNNVGVMEEAMHSFGAVLPELDQYFVEEQEIYQALAFFDKNYDDRFADYDKIRFVRWHENSVDVVPHDGSKAATIVHLADQVGIAQEDIISFGDGQNDREMLRMSGIGVAMGNAAPEVQAEAKLVTDTNDQDGIWKALKELAFI